MLLDRDKKTSGICIGISLLILMVFTWRLHDIFFLMCNDLIISDVPLHVQMALAKQDYSLASYVVRGIFSLLDESAAFNFLSRVLTANVLLGIFTLWLLISEIFPDVNKNYTFLAVVLAHLCGPWIIPGLQTEVYLEAYNGNIYHNMTMLFCRSFIPLSLLFFLRCWDARHGIIKVGDWLGFALSFLVCTLFKPSFAFAFAPFMAILLIYDFVKYKGKWVKNEIILGLAVVPAGLICIAQYLVLFSVSFAGDGSGIVLKTLTLRNVCGLAVRYARGILLPVVIFLFYFTESKEIKSEQEHILLILGCSLIAIMQGAFLVETGSRSEHGNMEWGALSLYSSIFSISLVILIRKLAKTLFGSEKNANYIYISVSIILLIGHLVSGTYCLAQPGQTGYFWWGF